MPIDRNRHIYPHVTELIANLRVFYHNHRYIIYGKKYTKSMITLSNVTKKFGAFTAVDNITIDIQAGELFGFLGPNGAGKTTTIKMLSGLFVPTSGSITINGFDIQRRSLRAKQFIGYVPDQPFLYDKLTGREFLYFVGGLYRLNGAVLGEKIDSLLSHFEIGDWIDKRAEEYSLGMRQRISIAAALIHDPRVIILDEPMVGLDPKTAKRIKETLKSLSQSGTTVFMSTHSLNIVEELCDRISIIKEGRIIFNDSIDRLDAFRERTDGKFESVFIELTK
jgi:ABC-2 type transport system ATP-binding protein